MNTVLGTISTITVEGQLSLVQVQAGTLQFSTIIIDTPETANYLQKGNSIKLLFKETEVIVATGDISQISLQNKLPGIILFIEHNILLSKIIIRTEVGDITSIITSNAVKQLALVEGQQVTALIKTNEIMLEHV